MREYNPQKIDSMSGEELTKLVFKLEERYWRVADNSGESYADGTYVGIKVMHAFIRFHGMNYVSVAAPKDWAWQLVGILGCGYSGVTEGLVRAALIKEGWQKGGSLDERH